jgi:predicted DNA-binding antitoxin AbrB/MazE fold protein
MTSTVHAVYENGVFRPVEPVDLPDHTPVELELRIPGEQGHGEVLGGLASICAILGERYDSGHADTAARHSEHQP